MIRYSEQIKIERTFSSRQRELQKPASGVTAAKGNRTTKGQCYRGDRRGVKHDQERERESKGKGFATVQLSTTEFFRKRIPDKKTFQEMKTSQHASIFKGKGNDCDYCIHLCVLFIKRELQTWTQVCVFKHADKAWCEAKK